MKIRSFNLMIVFTLLCIHTKSQRVGIGTIEPLARLAVDSGLMIDQLNTHQNTLSSGGLLFGSDGLTGIARSGGEGLPHRRGLGFFTNGNRRMVLDSLGNLLLGVSSSYARLNVGGNMYITGNIGVGIADPLYDIHTTGSARIGGYVGINTDPVTSSRLTIAGNTYMDGNLSIGTPVSTYKLDVDNGPVRFRSDVRMDGILNPNNALTIGNNTSIDGSLTVGGRGIVRGSGSGQWRLVRLTVGYAGGVAANSDVIGATLNYNLGGATIAGIFVGPVAEEGTGSSNLNSLTLAPLNMTNTSCNFLIINGSSTTANMGTSTNPTRWQLTLLVFE
jgi:hypothetical protein